MPPIGSINTNVTILQTRQNGWPEVPHTHFTVQWCWPFQSVTCWRQKSPSCLKRCDRSCLTRFLPLPLIGRSMRSSVTWDAWRRQTSSLCTVSNSLWRPEAFLWWRGADGLGFLPAFLLRGLMIPRGMSSVVRVQKILWHRHRFPCLCFGIPQVSPPIALPLDMAPWEWKSPPHLS